jgi:hypothetical protein
MKTIDPNESDVNNNYDMILSKAYWTTPGEDIYLLIQTVDTPSLNALGMTEDAYVSWILDFNGDSTPDLFAKLVKDDNPAYESPDNLTRYYINGVQQDASYWAKGSVIEVKIPASLVPTFNNGKIQMYVEYDNGGGGAESSDDRLPNSGWVKTVPEPMSMSLLGLGLLGMLGAGFRRKK